MLDENLAEMLKTKLKTLRRLLSIQVENAEENIQVRLKALLTQIDKLIKNPPPLDLKTISALNPFTNVFAQLNLESNPSEHLAELIDQLEKWFESLRPPTPPSS